MNGHVINYLLLRFNDLKSLLHFLPLAVDEIHSLALRLLVSVVVANTRQHVVGTHVLAMLQLLMQTQPGALFKLFVATQYVTGIRVILGVRIDVFR